MWCSQPSRHCPRHVEQCKRFGCCHLLTLMALYEWTLSSSTMLTRSTSWRPTRLRGPSTLPLFLLTGLTWVNVNYFVYYFLVSYDRLFAHLRPETLVATSISRSARALRDACIVFLVGASRRRSRGHGCHDHLHQDWKVRNSSLSPRFWGGVWQDQGSLRSH